MNLDRERRAADEFLRRQRPGFDIFFDPHGALAERFDSGIDDHIHFRKEAASGGRDFGGCGCN